MSISYSSSLSGTQISVHNDENHGQRSLPSHQIQSSPILAPQDNVSKLSTSNSDGEPCMFTGLHHNSPASSSFRLLRQAISEKTKHPASSLHRNLSGSRYLSKLGPKRIFRRQNSENRTCPRTMRSSETGEASGIGYDTKQVLTISQIVEASKREEFVWSDVNGSSQVSWNTDVDGVEDEHVPLPIERIRVFNVHVADNDTWGIGTAIQKCDLCSRSLSLRFPWSIDFPVVGVLACGHVFHGDCLEKSVPDVHNDDPPCPLCARIENVASKTFMLKLDGGMRGTMASLRSKLAKTFNRRSSASSVAVMKAAKMKWPSMSSSVSNKDSAKFPPKLQFSTRPESMKDLALSYPGPARVSPDQS